MTNEAQSGHTGGPVLSKHDVRQPLNIMQLSCANLRARIAPALLERDAAYFELKLARIEEQIARLDGMLRDPAREETDRYPRQGSEEH